MARPQRYPNRFEFWSTDEQMRGLEMLTSDGLCDKATHLRQALGMYLRACGFAPSRPAPNGQHHQDTRSTANAV
jgi:hypothetical protein